MKRFFVIVAGIFVFSALAYDMAAHFEPYTTGSTRDDPTCELPCKCQYLRGDHVPEDWDPETETYPTNVAWEKCMGVR